MGRKGVPTDKFFKVLEPLSPAGWAGFGLTFVIAVIGTVWVIKFHPHLVEDLDLYISNVSR